MNNPAATQHTSQNCIAACNRCHEVCLQTAMNYCLKSGGQHVEAEHFRLIMSCVEICQASPNLQLSSTHNHQRICDVCTEICEACEKDCEKIRTMDQYIEMNFGQNANGQHVEAEHIRLLMNCAEICQTSANFQLSDSPFQHSVCAVCVEVCEACAADCEKIGGMNECVDACQDCAKSCREMTCVYH